MPADPRNPSLTMLKGLQRDRWLATLLLVGLLILLVLVLRDYGVGLPQFPNTSRRSESVLIPITENRLEELLTPSAVPTLHTTNLNNPFFTAHFQPPTPPAPTTRKVNMTYQGFYQTADGDKYAFVQVDDTDVTVASGRPIVADLSVSEINVQTLTLTNSASRTNVLEFNRTTSVEVPAP
jgi:hypothetical protein